MMRCGILQLLVAMAVAVEPLSVQPYLGDGAVLQRERPLRIAGRAAAEAAVEVRLAGALATAVAATDGSWSVELPAMSAGGPHELSVTTAGASLVLRDLLIGDVWLCSGQSNMGVPMRDIVGARRHLATLAGAHIRLLRIRSRVADRPLTAAASDQAGWSVCAGEAAEGFSAVAIAFARGVQAGGVDVPIGLIQCNRAGTFCEAWIPHPALEPTDDGRRILARWAWIDGERDRLDAAWRVEHAAWTAAHGSRFEQWKAMPVGGPFLPHEPARPPAADSPLRPGVLWNGMVAPLVGTALRGVLWYQGESNSDRPGQYRRLLELLVASWRSAFRDPELPFIIVQLPEYETGSCPYDWQDQGPWEALRAAQAAVAGSVPGVHMAVTLGLGERRDIHPRDKWQVGQRMARAALAQVHGRPVAWSGPRISALARSGMRWIVDVRNYGTGVATIDGQAPAGFVIAGADRRFVPAQAEILAPDRIAVWAPSVPDPIAVRYAWDDDPAFNLVCSDGLPMAPFRSDDWPLPDEGAVVPFHRTWPESAVPR